MALKEAPKPHKWHFLASTREAALRLVMVCERCGLARVEALPGAGGEGLVNIGGNCPA
jgi:hypothetical protein